MIIKDVLRGKMIACWRTL